MRAGIKGRKAEQAGNDDEKTSPCVIRLHNSVPRKETSPIAKWCGPPARCSAIVHSATCRIERSATTVTCMSRARFTIRCTDAEANQERSALGFSRATKI